MMDVREKLEVIAHIGDHITYKEDIGICYDSALAKVIEDAYMALKNGVTVQEHGYWETVVEVRDNTVCGNGVKIEYKRCSRCKNPAKFFEDDFCGRCGAKMMPQPPKGE